MALRSCHGGGEERFPALTSPDDRGQGGEAKAPAAPWQRCHKPLPCRAGAPVGILPWLLQSQQTPAAKATANSNGICWC